MPLIHVDDLHFSRPGFTLHVPKWQVGPGEVVGLVGENGAGKSTLLRLVHGMERPESGSVRTHGRDPWHDPVFVRTRTGFMTDDLPLFPARVGALFSMLAPYYPTWDMTLATELLQRFGLTPSDHVNHLSKGQGTRLRLVTAMAFRPKLLVLDEPATGLDLGGRRALLSTVIDLVQDGTVGVVLSSHDLSDVERVATRLTVLHQGAIIEDGSPSALLGDGEHLDAAMERWGIVG